MTFLTSFLHVNDWLTKAFSSGLLKSLRKPNEKHHTRDKKSDVTENRIECLSILTNLSFDLCLLSSKPNLGFH